MKIFKSSRGLVDLQSVLVAAVISLLVASIAMVSIVGMTRMSDIDAGKTKLRVVAEGAESYYTLNDQYAPDLQTLADGDFIPKSILSGDDTPCYAPAAGAYPQTFTSAVKIPTTKDIFFVDTMTKKPTVTTDSKCLT